MKRIASIVLFCLITSALNAQAKQFHIVGSNGGNAIYWLDGIPTILPKEGNSAWATAIAVSGSDVHIVGGDTKYSNGRYVRTDAVYWLNGVQTVLPAAATDPRATAIAVSGSDVYIAGRDGADAVYWLNNERIILPRTGPPGMLPVAWATAIAVSGSDVYIVGRDDNDAVYWLNGIKTVLPSKGEHPGATAKGIAILGSDVYIVGTDGLDAVYWLNGVRTVLYEGTFRPYSAASADAISISGSDIYIKGAGTDIGMRYWRNGIMSEPFNFELTDEETAEKSVEAIAVLDSDVYIIGTDNGDAVLWLNGNRLLLKELKESDQWPTPRINWVENSAAIVIK